MASSSVFLGVMHASIRVDILRRYYDTPAMQQLPVCCLVHSSHWRKAQYLVTLDTKRLQGLSWSVESSVSPLQCLQAWGNCGFYRQNLSLPLSILLEIEHCRTLCICRLQHEIKNAPGSPQGSRTSFTNFPFQRTTSTSTKLGSTSPVLCDLLLSVLRYTSLCFVMARTQKANLCAILKRNVWHDASPSLLILSADNEITDQICSFCELSKPRSDLQRANLFRSSTDKNFFLPSFVDIIRTLSNKRPAIHDEPCKRSTHRRGEEVNSPSYTILNNAYAFIVRCHHECCHSIFLLSFNCANAMHTCRNSGGGNICCVQT